MATGIDRHAVPDGVLNLVWNQGHAKFFTGVAGVIVSTSPNYVYSDAALAKYTSGQISREGPEFAEFLERYYEGLPPRTDLRVRPPNPAPVMHTGGNEKVNEYHRAHYLTVQHPNDNDYAKWTIGQAAIDNALAGLLPPGVAAYIFELEGIDPAIYQEDPMATTTTKPAAPAPTCWDTVSAVLPHASRVLLYGPPGTGKTRAGIYEGLRDGQDVYSIYITEYTPVSEPRGNIFPTVEEGQRVYRWQDGPAVLAYRNGHRLVVNEIDKASDDCMTFFLALFDDESVSRITLPTGEIVQRHPNFSVVATMNARPIALIDPLRDRFTVTIHVDKVHPEAIKALPAGIRSVAEGTANADVLEDRIGIRSWNEFVHLRAHIGDDMAGSILFGKQKKTVLDAVVAREVALKVAAKDPALKVKVEA